MARGRRRQHVPRLPVPAAVPARLAGAGRPRPLPRGRHPDPHLAARRRLGRCSASSPAPRRGGVAHLPAVAQRRRLRHRATRYFGKDIGFYVFDLPWLHYLVDFAMAVAVVALLAAAARALPVRRHPAADAAATGSPAPRRCSSRCCSACSCSPRPPTTGSTASTWSTQSGNADHRHHLHRRQRGAAGQEHPARHRGHLRGAVLPQRLAPHLDAAVGRASRCSCCRRSCSG